MKFAPAEADEHAFVYDSWSRSFQKSPFAGCIPNHLYPQVSRACISETLERGARVLVMYADLPEGGRRVAGYSVSEPDKAVLHWLFVKKGWRGLGKGRELLAETVAAFPQGDWTYTHRTRASTKFLGPAFRWDPVPARVKA
jgi:GNAT superfamily N-acetyltransferase